MKELLQQTIKDINDRIHTARETMKDLIRSLPEEVDGVTRLGPRCGTVSLNTISRNHMILSPECYLTATIKETLIKSWARSPTAPAGCR